MQRLRIFSSFTPPLKDRLAARASGSGSETKRLPGLDGLRLFAAFAVIAYHGLFRGPHSEWAGSLHFSGIEDYAVYGRLGVELFFVISGYVIAWSAQGRDALGFARARMLRLWPAFVVCMTMSALIQALAHDPNFPVTLQVWAANLVFMPLALHQPFIDGAYWTIVAEITFYVWVFLGLATGLYQRRIVDIGAVWLAIAVTNNFVLHTHFLDHLFVTNYAGEFLGGLLIYRISQGERSWEMIGLLAASMVVAVVFGSGMEIREFQWSLGYQMNPWIISGLILSTFALVALASQVRLGQRATKIAAIAGGVTYPIYLLHQNVEYIVSARLVALGVPPLAAFLTVVSVLLLWAYVVFTRIEPFGKRVLTLAIDQVVATLRSLPNRAREQRWFEWKRSSKPASPVAFGASQESLKLAIRRRT